MSLDSNGACRHSLRTRALHRPPLAGSVRESRRFFPALALALALAFIPSAVPAQSDPAPTAAATATTSPERSVWDAPEPWRSDRFYLETSVYTRHYSYDPDHVDQQNLILFEYNITESWLVGGAVFDNSFGQSSQFVYGGYRFRPFENLQPLYIKVAAGVLHGYRGEFQDKIPMNSSGFAPGIVPSVGYCIRRYCSEVVFFGTAGLLVTFGVTLP
ncbi:MAG: hypothetical protein IT521_10490 [Burkholderiales bacterium]|nr:hypothetical protein [Burkholderiales bacterium]